MVEVSFCIRTLPDRLRNGARSYCYIVEGRMNVEKYPLQCFFFAKTLFWGFWTIFSHRYLYRNRYKCVKSETCYEKYHEKKIHYMLDRALH